jgi:psiF repeat
MNMSKILGAAVAALVLSAGVSMADTSATTGTVKPASTASSTSKHAMMAKAHKSHGTLAVRSEISKECSTQADAQSLHGKPRRDFRKTCMKAAKLSKTGAKHAAAATGKPDAASTSVAR